MASVVSSFARRPLEAAGVNPSVPPAAVMLPAGAASAQSRMSRSLDLSITQKDLKMI
jgi:hypothetical protein